MEVQQNPIFEDAPMEEPWSGVEGPEGTVVREDGPQTEAERPLEESTRMDVLEAPAADHEWAPPSSLDPASRLPSNLHNRVAAISDDDWLHDRDLADALDSHRSKSSSSWLVFAGLAYKSIGIVYGDLGTSPMYLWQTCFTKTATEEDIIGALSLVLWTLSLIIFKYVVVVLPANDMGEGGTFAIYSLLCRYTKITIFGLKHDSDKALSVYHQDPKRPKKKRSHPGRAVGKALEKSPALQKMLLVFVLCGTCALVGDGVLTPAVTVLSAMTGLQVPKELLREDGSAIIPNGAVIAATCIIMAIIFGCQRLGTNRISFIFAPILISFFVLNAGIGMYNIHTWNPAIFKAFSPHHGIMYLVRNKKEGWISLGGICLCITGVEGLFADLGHFNVQAIRASTLTVVYPSLLLIYLGQGAYLSRNPGDTPQAYFKAIPEPVFWPAFVLATLATMVASQAITSGVFSIISQSMSLQCFPKMKVIHTSKTVQGQIYIPNVNWALMTLGIACVLGFSLPQPSDMPLNGDALGHAFGIAVMCVMIITTCLVTLVMLVIWRTHVVVIAIFFGWFMFMESIYLSSNLFKRQAT
ncbi:hypothetical protein KFL_012790010 [Klebsormidium nitens]|uniref:K+ potassium transporter integral membrane domain-containing protein n=1 Tax=Klebsormidium nitens TaxID=105231 RepID=A0A1Y1IQ61_KLENI|nr:hypothetical protein KFL_012790010 [Klebsormidium nitens]|eukprot:GAQ93065.1 hypothetical protein KFL_012790010 [Klebsormidium nitens]